MTPFSMYVGETSELEVLHDFTNVGDAILVLRKDSPTGIVVFNTQYTQDATHWTVVPATSTTPGTVTFKFLKADTNSLTNSICYYSLALIGNSQSLGSSSRKVVAAGVMNLIQHALGGLA